MLLCLGKSPHKKERDTRKKDRKERDNNKKTDHCHGLERKRRSEEASSQLTEILRSFFLFSQFLDERRRVVQMKKKLTPRHECTHTRVDFHPPSLSFSLSRLPLCLPVCLSLSMKEARSPPTACLYRPLRAMDHSLSPSLSPPHKGKSTSD